MPRTSFRILICLFLLTAAPLVGEPLRVGITPDGEPLTFVDAKGVPRGFAVEIMQAVAREMQVEVTFVPKTWTVMIEDFKSGRTDALASIFYTEERATWLEHTTPHAVFKGAIFVRKGDRSIARPIDLRDRRVATRPGSAPSSYLLAHGWGEHAVASVNLRDALRALAEGRADAVVDALSIGQKIIRDENLADVIVAGVALPDFAPRLHAGFKPGDRARLDLFNEGLARIHANGTYDRIYERWLAPLESNERDLGALQPYFLPGALVIALIAAVILWQRRVLSRVARQAEALRESEERLTFVLEGSDDGFWDWDLVTNRVARSERWAGMLGYRVEEIPPTLEAGRDLIHPDDRYVQELFNERLDASDDRRSNIEYRMRTKQGDWRWILNRGKVVARAPDGTPLRMAGTHTDITDLKRAREENARVEARFRFVYEQAPVGLSWMRRDHLESRLVNAAYERITGISAEEARRPGSYITATHPDDRPRQKLLEDQLSRGEVPHFSIEKRYVHSDGRTVWAMLTRHLFREPGSGEVHEVTTLVDITDRKHAELERERLSVKMLEAQKLESLGVLAGGIAHDFNNLLAIILMNATLARDDGHMNSDHLTHIETAARRAADLCRQMLAYAGKGSFVSEQVELGSLVRETAHLLAVSVSKKARLELSLSPALPLIEADLSQLRQVVMNLVINASEALGDAAGEIRLATRLGRPENAPAAVVHSFDLPPGDCVCLEIADTGHGMNPETLARIFDPFFTTKFTGRGLGLPAALGIVRTHRGALTVASAPGQGTTVRLYLPLPARKLTALPPAAVPVMRSTPGHGTLLIADDEPGVLHTLDVMLRRRGYSTVLARNGDEAIQRFRETPDRFAATLLDLTMPGRDGAEVLAAIRGERPFARVLVMSGFSEADILERLRGLGEVGVLRKPFTQEILMAQVAALIADSSEGSPGADDPHL